MFLRSLRLLPLRLLPLQIAFLFAISVSCHVSSSLASAPDENQSFQLSIDSALTMVMQGRKQDLIGDTVVKYSWTVEDKKRTLILNSVKMDVSLDGNALLDTELTREKTVNKAGGETVEILAVDAPEELRQMMEDSFGSPICTVTLDDNYQVTDRKVVAGPGAKELVKQGMISNSLIFHPPFMKDQQEWKAPAEFSVGNGGFVKGDLEYTKSELKNGQQTVKVSGILTNDGFLQPGTPLEVKKVKYTIDGQQTFDLNKTEWTAGKLMVKVFYEMHVDGEQFGTTEGTMELTLKHLTDKP